MSDHPGTEIHNIHRRMDTQDQILTEIRDKIVAHIAEDDQRKVLDGPTSKALDEIVLLWRASKILVPLLVVIATGVWSLSVWIREHVR